MRAGRDAPAGTLASSCAGITRWYAFIKLTGARFCPLLQIAFDHGVTEYLEDGWIGESEVIRWKPRCIAPSAVPC